MKTNVSYIPRRSSNRSLTVLFDPAWKEMTEHQELLLMILDIREELLENIYKEYTKKNLEKQSAKFVVNCAHDAWKKLVNLNFLHHNFQNLGNNIYWVPDSELVICKPDSWSRANLKLNMKGNPREMFQQTDDDPDYIIESVPYPTSNVYEPPLKENDLVAVPEDEIVCNPIATVSSELRNMKANTPQSIVQFSDPTFTNTSERMSASIAHVTATSESNLFYRLMKMPKQSLSSLISSTFRTPQKLHMYPWYLEDEIHDDFKRIFTITHLRLNAAIILKPPSCMNFGLRTSGRESRSYPYAQFPSRSNLTRKSNKFKESKRRSTFLQFFPVVDAPNK